MLKRISSCVFAAVVAVMVMSGCKKDYESAQTIDDAKIEEYLRKNNVAATKDPQGTGFYYQIVNQGAGEFYKNTDSVFFTISLKSLLNGNTYYTSPAYSNSGTYVGYATQILGMKLPGLQMMLNMMKPGATVRMILPSYLAFGKNGSETIGVPSNEIVDLAITTYTEKSQALLDDKWIKQFIADKGLTNAMKDTATGVYYIVNSAGDTSGAAIDLTSLLTINYTGRFFDGASFESTTDGSYSTELTSTIRGWEVLTKFKKGTKVRLLIPSWQGYGAAGKPASVYNAVAIPPNTNLDFDIEIAEAVK
ncbi:FKBP-type peptidyl-prolyl cis-trans isomerase [Pedobacter sp. JY14-1]|uniref:FKBP-type peptidyl-prolyl cis-trans isomerase n=1 Tax=Pedobacter sp. JY14-1 TaxID=3034151 RepID=UPI0023E25370|nr:FKBP-type peptidyl-prolyl cis-trans isomerase [Pedobacter sp. JY14-1]